MAVTDSEKLDLTVIPFNCTLVGKKVKVAGQKWQDVVVKTKVVNNQLLCYFDNGFICDNRTLKLY